jgi:hypothetical protein
MLDVKRCAPSSQLLLNPEEREIYAPVGPIRHHGVLEVPQSRHTMPAPHTFAFLMVLVTECTFSLRRLSIAAGEREYRTPHALHRVLAPDENTTQLARRQCRNQTKSPL